MFRLKRPALLLLSMIFSMISASLSASPGTPSGTEAPVQAQADDPPTESGEPTATIDQLHGRTTDIVRDMVGAVDAFFVTDDYATFEENQTRVRLRLNTDYLEHHGVDVSPKVKVYLVLPGLSDRLRLVVNDADSADGDDTASADDDGNDVALRWIGKQSKTQSLAFDLGLRLKSGNLDPFVRINTGIQYRVSDHWLGQTSNRLYYYSKTGVRNDLRQYFNRPISDNLLLRSRSRVQYFEENGHNPNLEQKFSVFHTLASQSALAYEAIWRNESQEDSPFDEDEITVSPQEKYQQFALQLRYRRSFLRPWLFFEVWPIVTWAEERDYEPALGGRLRLEINLGEHGDLRLDE